MSEPDTKTHSPMEVAEPLRRRVLILETDRLIQALIAEWLEMAGYQALRAIDTQAASADGCDFVLADVPAPLKSAREAVARLARAVPGRPVIAMSADVLDCGPSASDALARELGAAAVLVKPFSQEALLNAIERARA